MKQVDCRLTKLRGKAPTETEVDQMYAAIRMHADSKGYADPVGERQYWARKPFTDDWYLIIVMDFDK